MRRRGWQVSSGFLTLAALVLAACSSAPTPVDTALMEEGGAELYFTDGVAAISHDSSLQLRRPRRNTEVFTDQDFVWERGPRRLSGGPIVAGPLERERPIRAHASQPGYVYALLWRWDYGFLAHLPNEEHQSFNEWELVTRNGARIRGAPVPFRTLPLYRRPIGEGTVELPSRSYVGQWIVVGFEPSDAPVNATRAGAPTVEGAATRHNVVRPSQVVTLVSDDSVNTIRGYKDGSAVFSSAGEGFTAPNSPGRYALRVSTSTAEWTIPLTVGLELPDSQGWEESFFPVHFYNGWGYVGTFHPYPPLRKELEILSMFELGANTFYTSGENELIAALGVREILNIRRETRWLAREVDDPDTIRSSFRSVVRSVQPFRASTLGLYVEDEPPASALEGLRIFEEEKLRIAPEVELLYTVHGADRAAFWAEAGSTVRMIRSYPIRKARRDDTVASVFGELADRLADAQRDSAGGRLWLVAQSFGDLGKPGLWDVPTPAEIRLMVNLALARGTRALTYFCYDSSPRAKEWLVGLAVWPFVPANDLYQEVGRINRRIASMVPAITDLRWVEGIDQPEGRFDVQLLVDREGQAYAWITNLDTERAQEDKIGIGEAYEPVSVELEAGGGVLVKLVTRSGA